MYLLRFVIAVEGDHLAVQATQIAVQAHAFDDEEAAAVDIVLSSGDEAPGSSNTTPVTERPSSKCIKSKGTGNGKSSSTFSSLSAEEEEDI